MQPTFNVFVTVNQQRMHTRSKSTANITLKVGANMNSGLGSNTATEQRAIENCAVRLFGTQLGARNDEI